MGIVLLDGGSQKAVAKIKYDSDTHSVVCGLVPVHEPWFITRLEISTGI